MADIKDNIIDKNINISDLADAPIAPIAPVADEVQPAPDFDIAEAKATGNLDAELFARFQKFGRAINAASKGRGHGPKNGEVPGVAAHMPGTPGSSAQAEGGCAPRPRFYPGTGPGTGAYMGFGGHGPNHGPSAGCGPKGMGPNPMNLRNHGFGDPKGPGCGHAPFHGDRMGAMHIPNAPAPGFGPKNGFAPMGPMGPKCRPGFADGGQAGFGNPHARGFGEGGPQGPGFGEGFGPDFGRMGRGRVLVALSMQDNMTQKDLAFILGIRPQSLSELVGKLEADGFVTRTRSEADKRAVTVSLTDAGKAKAAKIQAKRNASAETIFAKLTEEEKATLLSLLEKLQG